MPNSKKSQGDSSVNNINSHTTETPEKSASISDGSAITFDIAAQRFLDRIAPGGRFAFQTFTDQKSSRHDRNDPLARQLFGSITQHHSQLKSLNDEGAGVYVAPNEIEGKRRNNSAVIRIRACWLDLDGSPLEPVLKGPLMPQIVTNTSPGRWHCFWCISNLNDDFDGWKCMQHALAKRFKGDNSMKNLAGVMRVPGYYHKKIEPHLVTIEQINDLPDYTAAEMLKAFVNGHDNDDDIDLNTEAKQELEKLTAELATMEENQTTKWGVGRNVNLNNMVHHIVEDFVNCGAILLSEVVQTFTEAAIACDCPGYKATIESAVKGALAKAGSATPFSEQWLALRLAEQYKNLRYVGKWKKWMHWDGKKWSEDEKRKVFYYAQKVCRDAAKSPRVKGKADRQRLQSASTRAAVVNLAQDFPELIATVEQWDANPWLLNTPDGIVDLQTGETRPHDPQAFMTKMVAVAPDFDIMTPIFNAYLERVQPDPEIRNYLQRRYGYSLTASTREETLDFDYGDGANGKGTMYGTVAGILDDYHAIAPISIFLASRNESHPTDVAHLASARLATATEIEEGRSWNEAKIKSLTGGDKITARRMREDFWDFKPNFKLHISGNNQPNLKSVDEAIRRRLIMVPWNVVIPKEERDSKLKDKLMAEWPGILAWMIKGCFFRQERGLDVPNCIMDATNEYIDGQNPMPEFIEEYFVVEKGAKAAADAVYPAWREFREERGERPGRQNQFVEKMRRAGFSKEKLKEGNFYLGLRQIKSTAGQPQQQSDNQENPAA